MKKSNKTNKQQETNIHSNLKRAEEWTSPRGTSFIKVLTSYGDNEKTKQQT